MAPVGLCTVNVRVFPLCESGTQARPRRGETAQAAVSTWPQLQKMDSVRPGTGYTCFLNACGNRHAFIRGEF